MIPVSRKSPPSLLASFPFPISQVSDSATETQKATCSSVMERRCFQTWHFMPRFSFWISFQKASKKGWLKPSIKYREHKVYWDESGRAFRAFLVQLLSSLTSPSLFSSRLLSALHRIHSGGAVDATEKIFSVFSLTNLNMNRNKYKIWYSEKDGTEKWSAFIYLFFYKWHILLVWEKRMLFFVYLQQYVFSFSAHRLWLLQISRNILWYYVRCWPTFFFFMF